MPGAEDGKCHPYSDLYRFQLFYIGASGAAMPTFLWFAVLRRMWQTDGVLQPQAELKNLKARITEIQTQLAESASKTQRSKDFAALVPPHADTTELDEELVHTLIEKIVIHENEIPDGQPVIRIEIYYRFIGKIQDQLSAKKVAKNKMKPAAPADSIA